MVSRVEENTVASRKGDGGKYVHIHVIGAPGSILGVIDITGSRFCEYTRHRIRISFSSLTT